MKNKISVLFIALFSFTLTLQAQINKGSTSLGGQISFSHGNAQDFTNDAHQESNQGYISLSAGKAVKDNSVIGLTVQFGAGKNYNTSSNLNKTANSQYGAGIFYRRYKSLAKDFYIFFEGSLGYSYSKNTYKDTTGITLSESTQSMSSLGLTAGVSYKILKNLHLEVTLPQLLYIGYSANKSTQQTTVSKSDGISFNSNLKPGTLDNLGIGFRFIF